eukprot:m.489395 g.489395  ORF g.489395 m.489395 type:complete len:778 (+) comp26701_c0_seq1:82-2415(+)
MDGSDDGGVEGDATLYSVDIDDHGAAPTYAEFTERQFVAAELLETVLCVEDTELEGVARDICLLMQDPEPLIRSRVMDQMGDILAQYTSRGQQECATDLLLPSVVRVLVDSYEQVRISARRRIVEVIHERIIPVETAMLAVQPLMKSFVSYPGEEVRTDALQFMADTAIYFGFDFVVREYLPCLRSLCSDVIFRVRKACPPCIVSLAHVVGHEFTEEALLPLFQALVEDNIWGVRKACAESLDSLAAEVTQDVRRGKLTHHFSVLASDSSRWVRSAVFKVLGPFIASFHEVAAGRYDALSDSEMGVSAEGGIRAAGEVTISVHSEDADGLGSDPPLLQSSPGPKGLAAPEAKVDEDAGFNSFEYWRPPMPEFDIDALLVTDDDTNPPTPSLKQPTPSSSHHSSPKLSKKGSGNGTAEDAASSADADAPPSPPELPIPDTLLEHFNSMVDPDSAREIDNDVVRMCAFSFPAVALVLGPEHWLLIRETYLVLAASDEWKVRSSLAASIHVLAEILGQEITEADLLPKFDLFLKDWDEVRIGVVKHLSRFLRVLPQERRAPYLPILLDLKETDESRNWRFRRLLSRELCDLAVLYPHEDVNQYLCPLALGFAADEIVCVQVAAQKTLAFLLTALHDASRPAAIKFVQSVIEKFCDSPKSMFRQGFVRFCFHFAMIGNADFFCEFLLPHVLVLATDSVPNVRLLVARLLSQTVTAAFVGGERAQSVEDARAQLREDQDSDVRFNAALEPSNNRDPLREFSMPDFTDEDVGDEDDGLMHSYA